MPSSPEAISFSLMPMFWPMIPDQPGFDWAVPYGARRIGETLAAIPRLHFKREIRTEAYRIQLFRAAPLAKPIRLSHSWPR